MGRFGLGLQQLWLGILERRFVLLGFLFLTVWVPVLAMLPFQEVFANGLLLHSFVQLGALSAINTVAIIFCVSILRVFNGRHANEPSAGWRWLVGHEEQAWRWQAYTLTTTAALVTPVTLAVWHRSEMPEASSTQWEFSVAIIGGLLSGWVLMMLVGLIKSWLIGNVEGKNFFPFEAKARRGLSASNRDPESITNGGFWQFDLQMMAYLGVIWLGHYLATRAFSEQIIPLVSAPLVLVQLIWICSAVLAGCSFWFDKIRMPTTLVVLLAMLLLRSVTFFAQENTFPVVKRADTKQNPTDFAQHITKQRMADQEALEQEDDRKTAVSAIASELDSQTWQAIQTRLKDKDTLVVVTCAGGGIHAAAWSAKVLESLCEAYPDFKDSIVVISAVSGGSVGTLHFAAQTYRPNKMPAATANDHETGAAHSKTPTPFHSATQSSLEAISYGMMTDDFYGLFLPVLSLQDRGRRLESSLAGNMPEPTAEETLGTWGDAALQGEMPFIVFNATDAVTGRRVLFDTVPTPVRTSNISLTSRPYNYRELLKYEQGRSFDVKAVTAARVSATFPYVSPFVSAEEGSELGQAVALGDGGYADNEGIVTAIDWLEFILRKWTDPTDNLTIKRVLVVRIMPNGMVDSLQTPRSGWLVKGSRWLTGPLETIANVRATSQAERGNVESDLTALYLMAAQSLPSEPEPEPEADIDSAVAASGAPPPSDIQPPPVVRKAIVPKIVFGKGTRSIQSDSGVPIDLDRGFRLDSKARSAAAKQQLDSSRLDVRQQPPPSEADPQRLRVPQQSIQPETVVANQVDTKLKALLASRVLIVDIPFLLKSDSQTELAPELPLNWKLSKQQTGWYQTAWENVYQNDLKPLFDEIFKHKSP